MEPNEVKAVFKKRKTMQIVLAVLMIPVFIVLFYTGQYPDALYFGYS